MTIHLNGKLHHCEKCGLPCIKKYKYKDQVIWLCYFCHKNMEDAEEELEELN